MLFSSFQVLSYPLQESFLKKKIQSTTHLFYQSLIIPFQKIQKKHVAKFILIGVSSLCSQITNQHMESAPIFHQIDQKAIHKIEKITPNGIFHPIQQIQQLIQKKFNLPDYNSSVYSSQQKAFLTVLTQAEGKQNYFYKDNKGIAIAYGWNPTRNSLSFNMMIAKKAELDDQQIQAIREISNNHNIYTVPQNLKNIRLSDQQMNQVAIALMPYYEEQFLDAMIYQSITKGRNKSRINSYGL